MNNAIRVWTALAVIGILHGAAAPSSAQRSWTPSARPPLNVTCLAVNSSGTVFTGTKYDGVYKSSDYGNTWSQLDTAQTGWDITCIVRGVFALCLYLYGWRQQLEESRRQLQNGVVHCV